MEMKVKVQLVVHVLRPNHAKGFCTASMSVANLTDKSVGDALDDGHDCPNCHFFTSLRATNFNRIMKYSAIPIHKFNVTVTIKRQDSLTIIS